MFISVEIDPDLLWVLSPKLRLVLRKRTLMSWVDNSGLIYSSITMVSPIISLKPDEKKSVKTSPKSKSGEYHYFRIYL